MVLEEMLQNVPIEQYGLIQGFFLPFLLVLVIFFGGLEVTRAFKKRINIMIAVILTLLSTQSPFFGWLATNLISLGGYAMLLAFISIFIVGTIVFAVERTRYIYYVGSPVKKVEKISEEIEKLYKKLERARDENERRHIMDTIRRLQNEREVWVRR